MQSKEESTLACNLCSTYLYGILTVCFNIISTLKRRIPDPDNPKWRHMQLFMVSRKEADPGIWMDDYKFLASYKLQNEVSLRSEIYST